jgi:hypothetical protein
MVLYEDKLVRLEFDESIPCVVWQPIEFMEGEQFKRPFVIGMDFFERKIADLPTLSWLNDTRKLRAVKTDDVKWLNINVNERAASFGARKVAFVLPENIFGKMSVKLYVEFTSRRNNNNLAIKAFNNIDKARTWLKSTSDIPVGEVSL